MAFAMASMVSARPTDTNPDGGNPRTDWVSQDGQGRVIYCTPSPGSAEIGPITLPAGQTITTYFPQAWIGNCYAVIDGEENKTGMLAEFCWDSYAGASFFDLSAIVNPNDLNNIIAMMPGVGDTPMSGCLTGVGPDCNNIYRAPDDVQTKTTTQNYLKVFIGLASSPASTAPAVPTAPVSTRSIGKHHSHSVSHSHVLNAQHE